MWQRTGQLLINRHRPLSYRCRITGRRHTACHEACWLRDFLRQAAGEAVTVVPVAAVPGWFVNCSRDASGSDVLVINPKMHSVFTEKRNWTAMSNSLRNGIIHASTQRHPTPN